MSYKLHIDGKKTGDRVYTLSLILYDEAHKNMSLIELEAVYNSECKNHMDKLKVSTKELFDMTILNDACLIDFIGDSLSDFIKNEISEYKRIESKIYNYSDSFKEKVKRSTLRHLEGEE